MTTLAELDASALPKEVVSAGPRFADVLARVLKRPKGEAVEGGE